MRGDGFDFMTKTSSAVLHPVAFGCRQTRGNETKLHSHLGEGFAGDWAINKNRHMCFGQRFTWVTDYYAIKFNLSYDGRNPSILRLQMRFMCWDMDIEHRNDTFLGDADYWSRLGEDLCFDPLLKTYIEQVNSFRQRSPSPTALPPSPANMPYFRGLRLPTAAATPTNSHNPVHTSIAFDSAHHTIGLQHLSNHAVQFGTYSEPRSSPVHSTWPLYNSDVTVVANILSKFDWAVYGFNDGCFSSMITKLGMPFCVVLACNPYANGRALFQEVSLCPTILSSAPALLNHICASGVTSPMTGYLIHLHRYLSTEPTNRFWEIQAQIVTQLWIIHALSMVVAFVHPDHDCRAVGINFTQRLRSDGWVLSDTKISFPSFGDSVSGSCWLIVAIHSNAEPDCRMFEIKTPPQIKPKPIARYIWAPFNKPELAISYSKDDKYFNNHAVNDNGLQPLRASTPSDAQHASSDAGTRVKYYLHRHDDNPSNLVGSAILSDIDLCPPFNPITNTTVFGHYFGIEFMHDGHTYVPAISPFEFVTCFCLTDELTYTLSHPSNTFCLDAAIPAHSSAQIFEVLLNRCIQIRSSNFEIFEPNQFAAPAACIQTFLNGAVGVRLPSPEQWAQAYLDDPETSAIIRFVQNPCTISNKSLEEAKLNANYRAALCQSQIALDNGILILHEPIVGSESYARLQLVPSHFRNLVFIAFHSNPLGAHLNVTRTLHRIRLRFYWPGMYGCITRMCNACPGCALTNPTRGRSRELIYSFPIEASMMDLHVDGYQAGKESGFEGSSHYLVACCGMCTFAAMEPITNANATTYASGIMKIILRYGFCHTVVLDKDSKFFGVCREALDLLNINCHVLSGGNHNPMLVESINRYLNQGLRIMCNERYSNRVALEAILLLIYALNSCPVPGTNISRSMVAVFREFAFPIDFSSGKHAELYSAPGTIESYSKVRASSHVVRSPCSLLRSSAAGITNSSTPDDKILTSILSATLFFPAEQRTPIQSVAKSTN
jgi:hypothetical protein